MQSQPDNNQTLPETNKQLFNQPRAMIIGIGVLIFLLAGAIFLLGAISTGQGSGCWFSPFCHVSNGTSAVSTTPIHDIAGAVAGTSAAIVLIAVVEAPLTVAVGVGVVVWLLLRSWL